MIFHSNTLGCQKTLYIRLSEKAAAFSIFHSTLQHFEVTSRLIHAKRRFTDTSCLKSIFNQRILSYDFPALHFKRHFYDTPSMKPYNISVACHYNAHNAREAIKFSIKISGLTLPVHSVRISRSLAHTSVSALTDWK